MFHLAKKILGLALILLGLLALVTPLTPGSWLVFIGLELVGIRFMFDPNNGWGKWAAKLGLTPRKDEKPTEEETRG
ncbi:MAG TPA: hypothetical protein VN397_02345 [Candidatus Methylomirabilis sp.]|nr:hypothetical protein [Candidatus Methylomirabilis sp.]